MSLSRTRKLETVIYISLWLLVMVICLLDVMRARSYTELPVVDIDLLRHLALGFLPFIVLFCVHNSLLIPRLLFRNRYMAYLCATALLVAVVWGFQYFHFFRNFVQHDFPERVMHHHGPRPLLPLPLFLDMVYDLLILGVNLAIALIFQRFEDKLEHESLMKANAENQLAYLKVQINPHFYMNMLNNIHGMIDINPEKAQEMLIDMSNLMRYMLYESSQSRIALSAEIGFLRNYLSLMRQRFPESRVEISSRLPAEEEIRGVMVPPLLFLVFIENAFKHGISYRAESFVSVRVEVSGGNVRFLCLNSIHPAFSEKKHEGIGLKNINQRLKLIFGDRYRLSTEATDKAYSVNLTIPANETKDSDN